jgi:hypothetical protein
MMADDSSRTCTKLLIGGAKLEACRASVPGGSSVSTPARIICMRRGSVTPLRFFSISVPDSLPASMMSQRNRLLTSQCASMSATMPRTLRM